MRVDRPVHFEVNNLKVLGYLKGTLGHSQDETVDWMCHWMHEGFTAFQQLIRTDTPFCFGDEIGMAVAAIRVERHDDLRAHLANHAGDAPHDLPMPEGFAMPGRENVAALIQTSVDDLGDEAKRAFYALGTLFAPRVTPELLAMVQAGMYVVFNERKDRVLSIENMPTEADIQRAADALRALARRSLARYVGPARYCAAYYAVHDLSQAFARAALTGEARSDAVAACVAYARHHAHKPDTPAGMAHHNALEADLPNLLGAAQFATENGQYAAVNWLGWDLGSGNSNFLDVRGRAAERMTLVRSAVEAASL